MGLSTSDFHGASSVTACHAASSPPFILIPRCYCTMFANLGNALCDVFDSLLWAIPTSITGGKHKRVIRCSVDKYIFIWACAARGHKGVNCVQSGLQKVPIHFQKVIKTFVSESEDLYFMWSSSLNISQTKEGIALCNAPTFTLPGIPDWCAKIQGPFALGINVSLNTLFVSVVRCFDPLVDGLPERAILGGFVS